MHAALLYQFADPDDLDTPDELPSQFEELPAADIDGTQYFDGRTIFDGTLAGELELEEESVVLGEDFITTEREERPRRVATDVYLDPEAGWVGCDSGTGEALLVDYARATLGQRPEPAVVDLKAFASAREDDLDTDGIVYSQSVDEGHAQDRAGTKWHDDASTGLIPVEGVAGLSISYLWEGIHVDAVLYASGYIAVYKDWPTDQFARWVAQEITPFLEIERETDAQTELPNDDVCADCGRESDDLKPHPEAPGGGLACLVCRDKYEDDDRGVAA
jgi:hypothetical protein